jgi:hypothetical protein
VSGAKDNPFTLDWSDVFLLIRLILAARKIDFSIAAAADVLQQIAYEERETGVIWISDAHINAIRQARLMPRCDV